MTKKWIHTLFAGILSVHALVGNELHGQDRPNGEESARAAMATFRTPLPSIQIELFAADPQIDSPLALAIDEKGAVLATEVHRFNRGTEENRTRPFLLDDDLRIQTVEDRLRMFEKWSDRFDGGMQWFTQHADKVRRLEDTDGDGRADRGTEFARFGETLDGLAAGVLTRDGDTYVTCIPNLWRLRDRNGDGVAEERDALLTGFGVNAAFLGHDLHGLVFGPDGRLYFSVGDRGFHVVSREGQTFEGPRTGAVFRCDPDGSNLEVVHRGLRNPQELAFDRFGNLFAADNNCDKGDHSRLVMIVEGGDSGWNMAYQTMAEPYLTGPWHAEQMWHIPPADQPAWVLPPVAKLGAGPSGFTFYPGIGLPARYDDHFFYCNYTGSGGVESFMVRPRGAGFELIDHHDFLTPIQATDVEFGYNGRLYVSDYVNLDWTGASLGGRIFALRDRAATESAEVQALPSLVSEGFRHREMTELAQLLAHGDHRVRLRAQWELVRRHAVDVLETATRGAREQQRLHGLWGLGQLARSEPAIVEKLVPCLADQRDRVRAWAARLLGETGNAELVPSLVPLLKDEYPAVRMYAAIALGRLGHADATSGLIEALIENDDQDPWLRHGLVRGLVGTTPANTLLSHARHEHRSVRLAALLALRHHHDARLAVFLTDPEISIVTEAARAIYDLGLDDALPLLAAWAERVSAANVRLPDALVRRVLAANQRLGGPSQVYLVGEIAVNRQQSLAVRREALETLRTWSLSANRDRVTGSWRPYPATGPQEVSDALAGQLVTWLGRLDPQLLPDALDLVRALNIPFDDQQLVGWARDPQRTDAARAAALRLLVTRDHARRSEIVELFLADASPQLRMAARESLTILDPGRAIETARTALEDETTSVPEKQHALQLIGARKEDQATLVLRLWGRRLTEGLVSAALELDVLEALAGREDESLRHAAASFEASLEDSTPFGRFRVSLEGGNAEKGRALFVGHLSAQCIRCHKVENTGGEAGPDLTRIAMRVPREQLLEALVRPSAKIAVGYGVVTFALDDGRLLVATIIDEDARRVVVRTESGDVKEIPVDSIDSRTEPRSAMPPMGEVLTRRELRDFVEFLSELR